MRRAVLAAAVPCEFASLLDLNCVMRCSHGSGVQHCSSQHSDACCGTWLCTKSVQRLESNPHAIRNAAHCSERRSRGGSAVLLLTVMACRSTMQYRRDRTSLF